MVDTPNLVLPFILAAQAQKHVTHNEALRVLDALVQLSVQDKDLSAPPASPADGARYIVAASPTGAWSGQGGRIAAWQDGAWAFLVPKEGWIAWVADEDKLYVFDGSAWTLLGIGGAGGVNPAPLVGVNATADETNRLSVSSSASLFNHEGSGHQMKINKAGAANTASLLFQTGFSGRAEMGLAGDDNYHFKVSADGATWKEAIVIDRATAEVRFPAMTPLAVEPLNLNGSMEISQENITNSVTLTASGALQTKYTVDGAMAAFRGTFVAAAQQVTDAPPGFSNSLKFTVSTAQASLGANDELSVLMPIEGVRTSRLSFGSANARATSYGFWIKANRTGTYSGSLRNSAKNRSYPFTFSIGAANTWEWKTVTVPSGDTGGTWLTDNSVGSYLNICIAGGSSRVGTAGSWAGSDYSGATGTTNGVAATSDTLQLTGVVVLPGLELPTAADSWKCQRSFPDALRDCQRYYCKAMPYGTAPADGVSAGQSLAWSRASTDRFAVVLQDLFPITMRAAPAMSFFNPTGAQTNKINDAGAGQHRAVGDVVTGERGWNIVNLAAGQTTSASSIHLVSWAASARLQ